MISNKEVRAVVVLYGSMKLFGSAKKLHNRELGMHYETVLRGLGFRVLGYSGYGNVRSHKYLSRDTAIAMGIHH